MRTQQLQALLTLAILLLTPVGGRLNAEKGDLQILRIDPDTSRVTIHVGKAGLFRFAGHTHEVIAPAVSGEVHFSPDDPTRSSVYLEIDAASLRVTGRGEPAEDVPEVQRVMLSDRVLDVARFPTIIFESRDLGLVEAGAHALVVMIAGDLTLHGVTRPQIVKVAVEIQPDGVIAQGELEIKQTDFGIKPVGVPGGLVKSKNELEISFSLRAGPAQAADVRLNASERHMARAARARGSVHRREPVRRHVKRPVTVAPCGISIAIVTPCDLGEDISELVPACPRLWGLYWPRYGVGSMETTS